MSDQDTQYKPYENLYQPIEESAYRVIHLLPGTFADDIRCLLEIRPELVMTSYEALSYQWGDESITRPLSIAPMRSHMAARWPLLESANKALGRKLKSIQLHLTPPMPLWVLVWCVGASCVSYFSSSLAEVPLPWDCLRFIPRDILFIGISIIMGVAFAQVIGLLISFAIEITETKPLFFLLDLISGPSSPGQPEEFTTLRVTTNLESALRHLRKEKQIRRLWIDALCINQKNEDEKRAQVQRMDRIYANAVSTTVWLGGYHGLEEPEWCGRRQPGDCEHSRQIEAAFKYVTFLSGSPTFPGSNLEPDEQRLFLASRQGLIELAKRGWWERLWVIQEVSLSTGRVFIRCGHNTCEFENFRSVWWFLFRKYPELRHDFSPSTYLITTTDAFCYSSAHDQSSPLCEYRHKRFGLFSSRHSFHSLRFPDRVLLILLRTSGRFKCRDDRDRLYAVLGVAAGVTVGPRRNIAFFMRSPLSFLPAVVAYSLIHALPISLGTRKLPTTLSTLILIFAPSIWSRYYGSTVRHWAISRPRYITLGHMTDLDAFKGEKANRTGFFTALAGYLARGTGNLSFLDALSCGEDKEDSLPSWVPDWSKEVRVSTYNLAERCIWTRFKITNAGKTLRVKGRCRRMVKVIRAADQQKLQSLPLWQNGFKKVAALPSQERPVLVRLLSELGRLTSPDHSKKLGRLEKWRALLLFFLVSCFLDEGLVRIKSQHKTTVYTDNAIAEGMGYLEAGKVSQGDLLLSVPSSFYHLVLRQGKVADRWRIIGLVDMACAEKWAQLYKNGRMQEFAIE